MHVHQKTEGGVAIVTPEGQFWGGKETDELDETFRSLIAGGNRDLIIDLGKVTHMNSPTLGVLVSVHANYMKRGARVVLCNVDRRIHNVFVITKLVLLFDIQPDLRNSRAALSVG